MKKPLIAIVFILVLFLNSSCSAIQFNIFNDPYVYVDKLSLIELLEKDIEQQKQMRKEMLKSWDTITNEKHGRKQQRKIRSIDRNIKIQGREIQYLNNREDERVELFIW